MHYVTILILVDGFLQSRDGAVFKNMYLSHNPYFSRWFSAIQAFLKKWIRDSVTILILVDGFLQLKPLKNSLSWVIVTILILVDGFLQSDGNNEVDAAMGRHNPYFSRWFSAIKHTDKVLANCSSHNPYFSRWFSAIYQTLKLT